MERTKAWNHLLFGTVTLFLIFVIAFCVACTVKSESEQTNIQKERYLRTLEKESVNLTRGLLDLEGYHNSGVMMTRVVDGSNSEYKLTIHHDKIMDLDSKETALLVEKIKELNHPDDLGEIRVCFLEN